MGAQQLRVFYKTFNTIVLWWSDGFPGALNLTPMIPRDFRLSDICVWSLLLFQSRVLSHINRSILIMNILEFLESHTCIYNICIEHISCYINIWCKHRVQHLIKYLTFTLIWTYKQTNCFLGLGYWKFCFCLFSCIVSYVLIFASVIS